MRRASRGLLALAVVALAAAAEAAGSLDATRGAAAAPGGPADYPGARWLTASARNYRPARRPVSSRITTIVIHTTEGSYLGTLHWFRNPGARAATQYVIRSRDGQVSQMVRETDEAYHAGNGRVNATSVGIEHEAFIGSCAWYTDAMYRSSARLVAYLTAKYGIPIDRRHIIGHNEVPDPRVAGRFGGVGHHTDPGRCWDWATYMALVRLYAGIAAPGTAERLADDGVPGALGLSPGWRIRTGGPGRFGRTSVTALPSAAGGEARFRLKLPVTGRYAVYAWWPAGRSWSSSAPVGVQTTTGLRWIRADQRRGGGGWTYLGTFPLRAGTGPKLRFSRRTEAGGQIAVDAVKVRLVRPLVTSQLVAPGAGWALSPRGLSWTADGGGSWRPISPPGVAAESIRGVRFLDPERGWLVASTGQAGRPLAAHRTVDGGVTWTRVPLPDVPDLDAAVPAAVSVAGPDAAAIVVRRQPSPAAFSRAVLLRTSDGGATWIRSSLPAAGEVAFQSDTQWWLAAGLVPEQLFVTRDGGRTWRRAKLPSPVAGRAALVYGLPQGGSSDGAVVPVSAAAGSRSAVAFQVTADAGRSWRTAARVTLPGPLAFGARVPTAVLPDGRWLAALGRQVVGVAPGSARTALGRLPAAVSSLGFVSPTDGWGTVAGACARACVVATSDGGASWRRLAPP